MAGFPALVFGLWTSADAMLTGVQWKVAVFSIL